MNNASSVDKTANLHYDVEKASKKMQNISILHFLF